MTTISKSQFKEKIESVIKTHMINDASEREFWHYGIRFENKERHVDDVITDLSRHNLDRDDERDFPAFGTDEYLNAAELEGVSAWDLDGQWLNCVGINKYTDELHYDAGHCYIIASDDIANCDDALDENEIVMVDAKVIAVIF